MSTLANAIFSDHDAMRTTIVTELLKDHAPPLVRVEIRQDVSVLLTYRMAKALLDQLTAFCPPPSSEGLTHVDPAEL